MAQSVDQVLAKALDDLEQFATLLSHELEDENPAPEAQALDDFYQWSRTLTPVFLLDRQGRVLHARPPRPEWVGKPLSDDPEAMATLNSLTPYISSTFALGFAQTRVLSVLVPVVGKRGDLAGVVGGGIDLSRGGVSGLINPMQLGKTA
ncbi:MAG: cache domain-containing protein [Chloroflexi bacterium]|nr:cache domain-containing protein [Chloroflexota bacterium]